MDKSLLYRFFRPTKLPVSILEGTYTADRLIKAPTFSDLCVYMDESFQVRCRQVNRQEAEKTITEYLKPLFGFALKRCKSVHDAEDLSQEIVIRAFRALLLKEIGRAHV